MKEYGSNVQKLVDYLVTIPDDSKRTKHAHILIELMRQIHPQMRDGSDYSKKLWDDLYIMANFDLNVDSPYPPPPKEILGKKPAKVNYNQQKLKHRYYGKNIELLVDKAINAKTFEERKAFTSYIVKLMQQFFLSWNKDNITEASCLNQIMELSNGKLAKEIEDLKQNGLIEDAGPIDNSGGHRGKQPASSVSKIRLGNGRRKKNNKNRYKKIR